MKKYVLFIAGILVVCLQACDIIEPPYSETVIGPQPGDTLVRKVLLEDYTGHKCPNCPAAAKIADTLSNYIYKDRVVVVGLHVSTSFASPSPGLFSNDYRTTAGTDLDNFFQISLSGLPKGMVNRKGFPSQQHKISPTAWASEVALNLQQPVEANIEITNTYNAASNELTTQLQSKFLTDKSGTYFLNVMYVEDSVISAQLYPNNKIDTFYVHKHLFRGMINGTWGEQIAVDPQQDFISNKTYTVTLRTDVKPEKCKVIAFIYNDATKEVIQAEETHLQ
ncbi:MAG: Omp28 family outer membrane lipoprotein [Bacteroidia bacterium]|nr:Omp28 family outer membrane lipoprotein [Bacteroidia bacterium]